MQQAHTLMPSHTPCHLFRLSERLVNNILGWSNIIQNVHHEDWEESSDQLDTKKTDQNLKDKSRQYDLQTVDDYS